jgi:hypothetical protein
LVRPVSRAAGAVADVLLDEDGIPARVRITKDARLGLGAGTIESSRDVFIALRGAIVVELPADALQLLPEVLQREHEK